MTVTEKGAFGAPFFIARFAVRCADPRRLNAARALASIYWSRPLALPSIP